MNRFQLTRVRKPQDQFPWWLENIIFVMIMLSIIHVVVDDAANIMHWPHDFMAIVVITGLFFDFIFTLEFLGRSLISLVRGNLLQYFKHGRGWADFLASLPPLLLVSGPALAALFLEGDPARMETVPGLLAAVLSVRVLRILRYFRIIKLFGKIQAADSVMAGRHTGKVSTMAAVAIILTAMIGLSVPGLRIGDSGDYFETRKTELAAIFKTVPGEEGPDAAELQLRITSDSRNADLIKLIGPDAKTIYANPRAAELSRAAFARAANIGGGRRAFLSRHVVDAQHARVSLMFFIAILCVFGSMMFLYTRTFTRQISDPIFTMNRGFREEDYNLEVRPDARHTSDEVYRLARAYNIKWLPLKRQILDYRRSRESLDMDLNDPDEVEF